MKAYYMGKYYDNESAVEDLNYLQQVRPHLYYQIKEPDCYLQHSDADKYAIWQIYFDEKSESRIDCNFRQYKNTSSPNFENDVILDVWNTRIEDWHPKKYVGVLSWRMFEKTGLNGYDVIEKLERCDTDVVVIFPRGYEKYEHPFTRKGYKSVNDLVDLVDNSGIFDFKLKDYQIEQNVWCNYWVAKPMVFSEYVSDYLLPCMRLIGDNAGEELHRGKMVKAQTFFYEGLFSVYLHRKRLTYKVI